MNKFTGFLFSVLLVVVSFGQAQPDSLTASLPLQRASERAAWMENIAIGTGVTFLVAANLATVLPSSPQKDDIVGPLFAASLLSYLILTPVALHMSDHVQESVVEKSSSYKDSDWEWASYWTGWGFTVAAATCFASACSGNGIEKIWGPLLAVGEGLKMGSVFVAKSERKQAMGSLSVAPALSMIDNHLAPGIVFTSQL